MIPRPANRLMMLRDASRDVSEAAERLRLATDALTAYALEDGHEPGLAEDAFAACVEAGCDLALALRSVEDVTLAVEYVRLNAATPLGRRRALTRKMPTAAGRPERAS